jgi:hypothetical protein
MSKRLLISIVVAGLLAIFGSGQASAAVLGQSYAVRVTPPKQDKTRFAPVRSLLATVTTPYDATFSPGGQQVAFTFSRDLRLDQGRLPACDAVAIGRPTAVAQAACPGGIVGRGSAELNNGLLHSVVTVFNGPPHQMYFHFDTNNGALVSVMTAVLNAKRNSITIPNLPYTPGVVITGVTIEMNRVRTGKKTYFVEARCRKKKWVNTIATTYHNGQSTGAKSVQRCKQKRSKR